MEAWLLAGCGDAARAARVHAEIKAAPSRRTAQQIAFNCMFSSACVSDTRAARAETYKLYESLRQGDNSQHGSLKCRRCGCSEVLVNLRQTRSADEGSTIYLTCTKPTCQHRQRI